MIFNRLHKDQRGSAMTEFVIGLPIFILIFSGMGTLYRLNDAKLRMTATANTDLWESAQESIQTTTNVSPIGALASIRSFGDLLTSGTQVGGIYKDSYAKVGVAALLVPGAPDTSKLSYTVLGIDDKFRTKSPAKVLLDDAIRVPRSFSGFGGFLREFIGATGSSLGLGAGIRYGSILVSEGKTTETVNTNYGNYTFKSPKMSVPLNTASVYRLAPIALIRLQHTADDVTDKSILNFNGWTDVDWGGAPDWGAGGTTPSGPDATCLAEIQAHSECRARITECRKKKFGFQKRRCRRRRRRACRRIEPSPACQSQVPTVTQPPQPTPAECAAFGLPPGCGTQIQDR